MRYTKSNVANRHPTFAHSDLLTRSHLQTKEKKINLSDFSLALAYTTTLGCRRGDDVTHAHIVQLKLSVMPHY